MVKIYLKGFERPISIVGEPLFEDERYYVINLDGIKRKVLWHNILYIEELGSPQSDKGAVLQDLIKEAAKRKEQKNLSSTPKIPQESQRAEMAQIQQNVPADITRVTQIEPEEEITYDAAHKANINIFFSGHKNDMITMEVSSSLMNGSYSPELAREIFSNQQIQSTMGDFIISGVPKMDQNNIYFDTKSTQEIKDKLNMASNMITSVAKAGASSALIGNNKPSLSIDPSFGIPGSPFDRLAKFSA